MSAIKFRKRLTKNKITIALSKKFGSKGFITVVKVIKIWRSSGESNKLRYVYPIWGTPGDIAIQKREIDYIKIKIEIKIVSLVLDFVVRLFIWHLQPIKIQVRLQFDLNTWCSFRVSASFIDDLMRIEKYSWSNCADACAYMCGHCLQMPFRQLCCSPARTSFQYFAHITFLAIGHWEQKYKWKYPEHATITKHSPLPSPTHTPRHPPPLPHAPPEAPKEGEMRNK